MSEINLFNHRIGEGLLALSMLATIHMSGASGTINLEKDSVSLTLAFNATIERNKVTVTLEDSAKDSIGNDASPLRHHIENVLKLRRQAHTLR